MSESIDLNKLIPKIWEGTLDRAVEDALGYYNKYTIVGLGKEDKPMSSIVLNNVIPTQMGDILDILTGLAGSTGADQERMSAHIKNQLRPELQRMGLVMVWSDEKECYTLVSDSDRALGARG